MKAVKLDEYETLDIVPVEYLIYKWIPKPGRIMLVGPPKNGKSFMALQMGLAMAQGTPFIGRDSVKSRVLYLQFDTPAPMWLERLKDVKQAGVDLSGQFYMNDPISFGKSWDIRDTPDRAEIRDLITAVEPDCVIIDALRKIHRAKENDSGEMSRVFDLLSGLTKDRASIIVHHTHKINERRDGRPTPSDASRGSTSMAADADMTILLLNKILSTEGRFDEELVTRIDRDESTDFLSFPELDNEAANRAVQAGLVELCKEFPNQTHNQLVPIVRKRLGLSKSSFYRQIRGCPCVHQTHPAKTSEPQPT